VPTTTRAAAPHPKAAPKADPSLVRQKRAALQLLTRLDALNRGEDAWGELDSFLTSDAFWPSEAGVTSPAELRDDAVRRGFWYDLVYDLTLLDEAACAFSLDEKLPPGWPRTPSLSEPPAIPA
jgi:hypothetical protein